MLGVELKKALLTTPLCEHLEPHELDMLLEQSKVVSFATGDTILQQGKKSEGIYIIIEGVVVVTAKILGEGLTHLVTLQHGNFIGVISSLGRSPNTTSIIASSNVQCLLITNVYLDMLSLFFPETKYKFTKAIANELCFRLQKIQSKITTFMSQTDMVTRSMFSEVIKSLSKPDLIMFKESDIDINQLKLTPLFTVFSQDEYNFLLQESSLIKAPKQCVLIQEKEKNSAYYIILRGAVQSSIVHENKFAKLSVLGPLTVFCNISLIDNTSLSIIKYATCERAILLKITESNIALIQKNNFQLWYKLFDFICQSFALLERAAEKLDIRLNSESYNR